MGLEQQALELALRRLGGDWSADDCARDYWEILKQLQQNQPIGESNAR